VRVNGAPVSGQGTRVFPEDAVMLDGERLRPERGRVYLALNKPPGHICSSSDPQGRPLAIDLLPGGIRERLYNVGRLDFMSCGLIFFTNDGDFAARLGHPSSGVEKEYVVEATGHVPDELLSSFLSGIVIEGVRYRARATGRIGSRCVRIVLVEGKNREIRRVFSHFRLHPFRLRRVRIGPVRLGDLAEGESRPLSEAEVTALLEGKGAPPGFPDRGAGRDRPEARTGARPGSRNEARPGAGPENRPAVPKKPRKELTW